MSSRVPDEQKQRALALRDRQTRTAARIHRRQTGDGPRIADGDKAALTGGDRREMAVAIAAQQQADAAVEPAGHRLGSEEIADAVEIRHAVTIEVGNDESVDGR